MTSKLQNLIYDISKDIEQIRSNIEIENFEYLDLIVDFIENEKDINKYIEHPYLQAIWDKMSPYHESFANIKNEFLKDQSRMMEVTEFFLQFIGSLIIKLKMILNYDYNKYVMKYDGDEGTKFHLTNYLSELFEDPYLSLKAVTEGSIVAEFETTLYNAVVSFFKGKLEDKDESFHPLEIEILSYPIKLLENNLFSEFITNYATVHMKKRKESRNVKNMQRLGVGKIFAEVVCNSTNEALLDYYSLPQVLLNYLWGIPGIETMDKKDFYADLGINEKTMKLIDEFLESFPYATAYTWFYGHILTCGDRTNITTLRNITFEDDINESELDVDNRKIRLFTLKSDISVDNIVSHFKSIFKDEANKQRWYHGTSRSSADKILNQGIETRYCYPVHDFGFKSAFYIGEDFKKSIEWAKKNCNIKTNDHPSVIIFKTYKLEILKDSKKPDVNDTWKLLDLSQNEEEWRKFVRMSRSGDTKGLKQYFPMANDHRKTDLIYGPIATNTKKIEHENFMQLALKSQDAQCYFRDCIEAVIILE